MRGKRDVGNFPACGSPELVTPGLSRRRAYRRAYVTSPRLTTTDVGLTPRLAYARVVHTAPVHFSGMKIWIKNFKTVTVAGQLICFKVEHPTSEMMSLFPYLPTKQFSAVIILKAAQSIIYNKLTV